MVKSHFEKMNRISSMALFALDQLSPDVHETAYVADSANVIGRVVLKAHSSVWFGATLRGDNEPIVIGEYSNVQESAVLHTDMGAPLTVGDHVTIGHQAMLHGCTVGDGSLIGIQAVVLNHAVIGKNCVIGACALVTSGMVIPDDSVVMGSPAKVVKQISEAAREDILKSAKSYAQRAKTYQTKLRPID
jgi:carbonic anhydrase/acetyltransferase-like protein (isoleucine patch superfamily)